MREHEFDLSENILDRKNIVPLSTPRASIYRQLEQLDLSIYHKAFLNLLSSPQIIQRFINNEIQYNRVSTKRSFKDIINHRSAHCFEAAYGLAYPVLHIWGYHPRAVYMNSDPDLYGEDHAIIVYRTMNGYGSVGIGADEYGFRPPVHSSFDSLMKSFYNHFGFYEKHNSFTRYVPVMKGYSDPIELLDEKGTTDWFWKEGDTALEHFWYHSTDDVMCTEVTTGNRYMYPPYMGE